MAVHRALPLWSWKRKAEALSQGRRKQVATVDLTIHKRIDVGPMHIVRSDEPGGHKFVELVGRPSVFQLKDREGLQQFLALNLTLDVSQARNKPEIVGTMKPPTVEH